MSSHSLRLTPRSEKDLGAILQFSLEAWGSKQRDARAKAITSALETLTLFPESGRRRDDLGADVRSYLVNPHAIYYRIEEGAILVLRIAHQHMDIKGRLED